MITVTYQFKHNVMWHCQIIFFLFPEQLHISLQEIKKNIIKIKPVIIVSNW